VDVAVLAACLALSGWLAIRARSREGIFLLSVFSIAYFGFFRKGCICPIGAIQNIALALADPSYAVPRFAVAFFVLPLVTALATGRTFCAAVCPFGALQDALIVRPLRLPRWLAVPLGFLPVVYLGLAVLFAATGAEFIVCRFDPFVNFFRVGGSVEISRWARASSRWARWCPPYCGPLPARCHPRRLSAPPSTRPSRDSCVQWAVRGEPRGCHPRTDLQASPPVCAGRASSAPAAALIAVPVLVAAGAALQGSSHRLAGSTPAVRLSYMPARTPLEEASTLERRLPDDGAVEELSQRPRRSAAASRRAARCLGFRMLVATQYPRAFHGGGGTNTSRPRGCVSCGRCRTVPASTCAGRRGP
jgi:ferredoxin